MTIPDIVTATRGHYVISAQDFKGLTPPLFAHWVVLLDVTRVDGAVSAPAKWRPREFTRGKIEGYGMFKMAEDEFRECYPRMIMADT